MPAREEHLQHCTFSLCFSSTGTCFCSLLQKQKVEMYKTRPDIQHFFYSCLTHLHDSNLNCCFYLFYVLFTEPISAVCLRKLRIEVLRWTARCAAMGRPAWSWICDSPGMMTSGNPSLRVMATPLLKMSGFSLRTCSMSPLSSCREMISPAGCEGEEMGTSGLTEKEDG